jgi:hypothetical protein
VARSPIATTFSCSELAAGGYCSLAQEHQKQADRLPGLGGIGSCLDNSSPEGGRPVASLRSPFNILSGICGAKFSKNLQSRLIALQYRTKYDNLGNLPRHIALGLIGDAKL